MDGITIHQEDHVRASHPIVICSTLTERGAQTTMEALAAGAVDIITKPKNRLKVLFGRINPAALQSIKSAARANVSRLRHCGHTHWSHSQS